MKVIRYIKPEIDIKKEDFGGFLMGNTQSFDHGDANQDAFFDEEEYDDEYDPFFDE